jgi:large subunit ribosomal protein L19
MEKQTISTIKAGDTVKIYQKYKDKGKDKVQVFEGMVICRKHGSEPGASITVRKVISGIGVEKIFPIHSPIIEKIEVKKSGKVRRAKLYYIRRAKGRKAKLKRVETPTADTITAEPAPKPATSETERLNQEA